jgi:acetolactate synthase-1/2/3 large subunit
MLVREVTARPVPRVEAVQAWCDPGGLRQLREMLLAAKKPFVIAGGSGWTPQSAQALQRFAENWKLPVGNAFRFQDTFDNHHPQYAGDVGIGINPKLAQRVRDSDLILAIGTRLGEMTTSGYTLLQAPKPTQKLVHIHSSAEELNRVYHADLAMMATMNAAARSLEVLDAPKDVPWQAWTHEANADYQANMQPQKLPGDIDMPAIVGVISKLLPDDAVLTNGAGNFASWVHRFHKHRGLAQGHKVQLAPTSGSMGYGVPAGIAASILTGRTVFTIAGDGDFLMNGQELATAVQHGAKTIIVLLNNSVYGTIRMHQERDYPNHSSGSYLKNPSFAQLAQAYGYAGVRITRTDEFEAAFKAAMDRKEGTLIEVMIDEDVITTRASLTTIREAAIARLAKS